MSLIYILFCWNNRSHILQIKKITHFVHRDKEKTFILHPFKISHISNTLSKFLITNHRLIQISSANRSLLTERVVSFSYMFKILQFVNTVKTFKIS